MNQQELFKKYKDISINIILALEKDDIDLLDDLLLKRQEVLEYILAKGSKEELQKLYKEFDLYNLDRIMKEKFKYKMDNLKKEMLQLKRRKKASKSYSNLNARAVYLNKEI